VTHTTEKFKSSKLTQCPTAFNAQMKAESEDVVLEVEKLFTQRYIKQEIENLTVKEFIKLSNDNKAEAEKILKDHPEFEKYVRSALTKGGQGYCLNKEAPLKDLVKTGTLSTSISNSDSAIKESSESSIDSSDNESSDNVSSESYNTPFNDVLNIDIPNQDVASTSSSSSSDDDLPLDAVIINNDAHPVVIGPVQQMNTRRDFGYFLSAFCKFITQHGSSDRTKICLMGSVYFLSAGTFMFFIVYCFILEFSKCFLRSHH
jgi:hypothetical protein